MIAFPAGGSYHAAGGAVTMLVTKPGEKDVTLRVTLLEKQFYPVWKPLPCEFGEQGCPLSYPVEEKHLPCKLPCQGNTYHASYRNEEKVAMLENKNAT